MSAPRLVFSLLLLTLMTSGLSASQPFSTLEERMTGQEFREAGLHKLSDDELAALNRWIQQRSLTLEEYRGDEIADRAEPTRKESSGDAAEDRRGFADSSERSTIRSRIAGNFSGWRGDTEFELENGMVWRQAESGEFAVSEMENPEVEIRPRLLGTWRLSVEGYNSTVRVERIR
jgi:hypothetical protein